MSSDLSGCIELASGRNLDVLHPAPGSVVLDDVAQGLSLTCRFSGQCKLFYSVAEHTLLVSRKLESEGASPLLQLAGLHHDDAEAFVTDVPRPIKHSMPGYDKIESDLELAILDQLGLDYLKDLVHHPAVKNADNWALMQEAGELLPSRGRGPLWDLWAEKTGHRWDGVDRRLGLIRWDWTKKDWLYRHRQLTAHDRLP